MNKTIHTAHLYLGDALDLYQKWSSPTTIVVDGPYGVGGYPGDPPTVDDLPEWYSPHIRAWAKAALPSTTLWFWGTELSWATVHPYLLAGGWDYRSFCIWDKGVAHIAGNVNSSTIRRFPVVTEACVQYVKRVELSSEGEIYTLQEWLRHEWQRAGLPLSLANEAAGVKNAATRKYLTADHLWYFPPPETMAKLVAYANQHGKQEGRPYFAVDGSPVSAEAWSALRSKWNHKHGLTNVWNQPALRGQERLKDENGKIIHTNQKPVQLMEDIISASSDRGDVVWEPFGGLCSASLAAIKLGRISYAAESNPVVYQAALKRLQEF